MSLHLNLRLVVSLLIPLAAAAGALAAPPAVPALSPIALEKVVIALRPDKSPEKMLRERRALETHLAQVIGRPVETLVPLSNAVIIEGLANGTIDLAYLSASSLAGERESRAATILLAGEIDGRTTYQSYWVALKEKPYRSIADLRGQPVAFASRTSTSGYIVPLWDLHRRGLVSETADAAEFFGAGNVWWGNGYVSAVERVLRGESEAAAVSYYVLDEANHLLPEQRARLRKFDEQGPVPTHVIAVRRSLPAADGEVLRAALLGLNAPAHAALRDRVFTSPLVVVDAEAHLAPVRAALAFARRAPGR